MRKFALSIAVLLVVAVFAGLWSTRARSVEPERFASVTADAGRGEQIYWAGGCASCHKAKDSEDATSLPGGQRFATEFGTFVAPNISSDPTHGLGSWTLAQFASALLNGTSPDGEHYYPSFPYTTYGRMSDQDVADLWAFMQTLPADPTPSAAHELGFPFNVRASLGGWKMLFVSRDWIAEAPTPELERGRYLVEALGHCAECHTPRNALGGPVVTDWMGGAPNPSGDGRIPGLTPEHLNWSAGDIAYYLETGFTPDFDSAGGEMTDVIANISQLTPEDRAAIAAYVKALPGG